MKFDWREDMKTRFLVSSLLIFVFILLVCAGCQESVLSEPGSEANGKEVVNVADPDPDTDPVAVPEPDPVVVPVPVPVPVPEPEDVKVEVVSTKKIGPKIEFESVVVDLGEISPKSKNPFKFKFKNVGDEPLKILNVSKVCGCTQPSWERRAYAPGQSGVIKVTYTASKVVGKVSKGLVATCNSKLERDKKVSLKVVGRIVKKIKVEPENLKLVFNKENAGCPNIKVTSVDGKAFAVTGFSTAGNAIKAVFDRNARSTEVVLEPKVNIEKLKSRMSGFIRISTSHPQCKSIQVRYTATPRFKVQPGSLILRGCDPNEPVTRVLWILSTYDEDFEISSISSKLDCVSLEKKEKVDNRYKLTIKVTPPYNKGKSILIDKLYINMTDDERLSVSCRLYYTSRK